MRCCHEVRETRRGLSSRTMPSRDNSLWAVRVYLVSLVYESLLIRGYSAMIRAVFVADSPFPGALAACSGAFHYPAFRVCVARRSSGISKTKIQTPIPC